jgi:hypothetical protein
VLGELCGLPALYSARSYLQPEFPVNLDAQGYPIESVAQATLAVFAPCTPNLRTFFVLKTATALRLIRSTTIESRVSCIGRTRASYRRALIPRLDSLPLLGSPRKRLAASFRNPEDRPTVFVYPILPKDSLPYELIEEIGRHLVNSIGIILDFGDEAILPLDANVFSIPIVFSLDRVVVPRQN